MDGSDHHHPQDQHRDDDEVDTLEVRIVPGPPLVSNARQVPGIAYSLADPGGFDLAGVALDDHLGVAQSDQGRIGIGTIQKELNGGLKPLSQPTREVRWDGNPEIGSSRLEKTVHLLPRPHSVSDIEIFGLGEPADQLPAFKRSVQVQDRQREVRHIVSDGIGAEGDLYRDGPDDEDNERPVPEELDELFFDEGHKPSHGSPDLLLES